MEYNIVTNIESCYSNIPIFLYYSHIPTAVVMMIVGFFIYFKNRQLISVKPLFLMAVFFSFWVICDIVIWISPDSRIVMFLWSIVNLLEIFVSISTLYFSYVFLEQRDISLKVKLLVIALLTPFIFLIPTSFNLQGFTTASCEAQQGSIMYYFYFLESVFSLWLFGYLFKKIFSVSEADRRQVLIFSLGVIFFLFSFSGTNIIASITGNWDILQYGLLAAPVFAAFLAYLIVRYRAFNIKLIGVQALIMAQLILIGSMLFVAHSLTNYILIAFTLAITLGAGWSLIRSVKKEVERKEELQKISDSLAAANQRLKELDNAKSEFISIASHQLRTPLTAIKGYTSLLLEGSYGPLAPPVHDILERLYSVNGRLVQLVEDLLNISRIEAGRIRYDFEPARIEPLVAELVDIFALAAKNKGIALKIQLPRKSIPMLLIDANKIKEVVSNLIDNAIKYTPDGEVKVIVEGVASGVRVIIEDTGVGIGPEDMDRLFQKFIRSKETSKIEVSGTGLGLYVGKSFVEAHRGRIWAESEGVGRGSRFIIELPFVNEEAGRGVSDCAAPMAKG